MSEDNLSDDTVEQVPDASPAEGSFPLTPRMVAIAKGEDPDAITSEVDDAPAEEVVDEQLADDAADEVAEDPAGETPEPTSWVTAADRARAKSYNLDAEDLDAYSSREDFGRALRLIDKAASRRDPSPAPQAPVTPSAKADEVADDTKPRDANGKLNLAYFAKNFDEATVELVKEQIANTEAREKQSQELAYFQQQQEEQEFVRYAQGFHQAAEELRPDFYGRTVDASGLPLDPSPAELDRRTKLWSKAHLVTESIIAEQQEAGMKVSVPPWPQVLKQAEVLAFGDEIAKHEKVAKQTTRAQDLRRLATQSQRRRPVASTASTHAAYRGAPPADPHSTESIVKHPDVEALLRRLEDKNR